MRTFGAVQRDQMTCGFSGTLQRRVSFDRGDISFRCQQPQQINLPQRKSTADPLLASVGCAAGGRCISLVPDTGQRDGECVNQAGKQRPKKCRTTPAFTSYVQLAGWADYGPVCFDSTTLCSGALVVNALWLQAFLYSCATSETKLNRSASQNCSLPRASNVCDMPHAASSVRSSFEEGCVSPEVTRTSFKLTLTLKLTRKYTKSVSHLFPY